MAGEQQKLGGGGVSVKHDLDALEVLLERAQQRAKLGWLPVPQEAATVFDALPDLIAAVKALPGMLEVAELAMPDSYFESDSRVRAAQKAARPFYGTER